MMTNKDRKFDEKAEIRQETTKIDIKLSDFRIWVYKYTNYNILQKNTCFFRSAFI